MVLVVNVGGVQGAVRVARQQRLAGGRSTSGYRPAIAARLPRLATGLGKIHAIDSLGTRAEVRQGVVLRAIVLGAGRNDQ